MGKSNTYICCLLLLSLFTANNLRAGDPVFSQFFAAPMYLNPAYAGSTACSRLGMNYRHWNSIDNFHVINFSYDVYAERLQGGLGVIVTSDLSNNQVIQTNMGLVYSYHARISDNSFLNLAVQAGYIRNDSRLKSGDFYDPGEEIPDRFRGHDLDFSAGAMYFSDRIYGGVAVHRLNDPNMSLVEDGEDRRGRKYTAHLGMYFEPQPRSFRPGEAANYFFSPNVIVQHNAYHEHFSGGIYLGREPLMVGGWIRHHRFHSRNEEDNASPTNNDDTSSLNTLVFMAGVNMGDYRVGISYDYPAGSSDFANLMTVLELSLAYRFNCPQRNIGRRIINNPNF